MKGLVSGGKGDFDKGWTFFKKAYEINPNDVYFTCNVGWFLAESGLHNHALNFLNKSLELDPLDIIAIRYRTLNFYWWGKFDLAEKDYQKVLELQPNHRLALAQYAHVLFLMNKYDAAKEISAKHYKLYPDSDWARYLKAIQFAVNREKDKALDIKLTGFFKGHLYIWLEMKEEAIEYLVKDSERKKKLGVSYYLGYKKNHQFDFLRTDSRFQQILAEHKKLYEENLRKYGDLKVN